MRKQTDDYKQIKGLVTDVNINNNVANPTFQNLSLTPIGKLTKRKGWNTITQYSEVGKDINNIKIDFDRLTTGVAGYPNINVFHCKPFINTVAGAEVTYRDILSHRIVNNVNEIWRTRYDNVNVIIEQKKISVDGQLQFPCNIKFIETPDHVYIVNDYHKGTVSGTVYKYKYAKDLKQFDVDLMQNLAIGEIYVTVTLQANGFNSKAGKYKYLVMPIYNTSTESGYDAFDSFVEVEFTISTSQIQYGTVVKILSSYDPFILGYKIYRTKVNTVGTTTLRTLSDLTQYLESSKKIDQFYFVGYYPKPDNNVNPSVYIPLNTNETILVGSNPQVPYKFTERQVADETLGELFINKKPINYLRHITYAANNMKPPQTALSVGYGILCNCLLYAQSRCFAGGDNRYPQTGFVSDLDKSDYFGDVSYTFELASLENRQTTIQEVGSNIYWFLKNSLYVLRPTSDVDVPYTKELVSPTVGCDSLNSACVLEGICYFIFNNKLWALNEFGQYKEISSAVNTQLTGNVSEIILKPNASERYIKIMFRNTAGDAVNIDYHPVQDLFNEQTGDKDIYSVNGNIATINLKDDRYKLVNYEQIPDLNEEWGVDIDGNIVKRATDYQDVNAGAQTQWLNYTADSTATVATYPVNAVIEKPFVFNSRVRFNSVILFGSGVIDMAYKVDTGAYSAYRTYTMTRTGTEIPLNGVGSIHSIKLRHTANTDIDFDFMKVKWTSQTNVDISNNVDAGA